jgi:hypothetical protein
MTLTTQMKYKGAKNYTQHNETKHNDGLYNETQHNDAQHNDMSLSCVMTLSSIIHHITQNNNKYTGTQRYNYPA